MKQTLSTHRLELWAAEPMLPRLGAPAEQHDEHESEPEHADDHEHTTTPEAEHEH